MKPASAPLLTLKSSAAKPSKGGSTPKKPTKPKRKINPQSSEAAMPASTKRAVTKPATKEKPAKQVQSAEVKKKPKPKKSASKIKQPTASPKPLLVKSKNAIDKTQANGKMPKALDIALEIEKKLAKGAVGSLNKSTGKSKDNWPPSIFRSTSNTESARKFIQAAAVL